MNSITKEIIAIIECAHTKRKKLNIDQTLQIISAYRRVSNDPEMMDKIIFLIKAYSKQEIYSETLTLRQNQIFNLISLDFSSREIAKTLNISEATVSTHRKNINKKLQISGAGTLKHISSLYLQSKLK